MSEDALTPAIQDVGARVRLRFDPRFLTLPLPLRLKIALACDCGSVAEEGRTACRLAGRAVTLAEAAASPGSAFCAYVFDPTA